MRKTLRAIAEGKFEYEQEQLLFSEERLEYLCCENKCIRGSFSMESTGNKAVKGVLYSTDIRMKCEQLQFYGKQVEIPFVFDTKGMEPQDTIKGEIYVETNLGEYQLPFVVTVVRHYMQTSVGKIKNLFHFANLAHENFEEAYRLFVSRKFTTIEMNTRERMLYELLGNTHGSRENMEEFLIAVRKKKQVLITINQKMQQETCDGTDLAGEIMLTKNGWGYVRVKVDCDAAFIRLEKKLIVGEDFNGNQLRYEYQVDSRLLHAGKNYARLTFSTLNEEQQVEVLVTVPQSREAASQRKKQLRLELCELYIQVRCKTIHNLSWMKESLLRVEKLLALGETDVMEQLFQAQLLVMSKKKEEAQWILEKIQKKTNKRQNPEAYAYVQYIQALARQEKEYTYRVRSEIIGLMEEHPRSFRLLWIRLFMDEELQLNPNRKYQLLKQQFSYGERSPFLYLEAYLLLKADVNLMNQFDDFEKQVLSFAVHQAMICEPVAVKAAKLVLGCRSFQKLTCHLMKTFYYLYETKECLEAVCSQLIRGAARRTDCFEWYEKGVLQDLKLNQLYEYYLETVPKDRLTLLPKQVLLYFSYQQALDYRQKAFLFANISRHRMEEPELYEEYEASINQFVYDQLPLYHVNEDLMYLYKVQMAVLVKDQSLQEILQELLFTTVVSCDNAAINRVVVCYEQFSHEEVFVLTDHKAYIRQYTEQAAIVLEDRDGKRHVETIPFEIKPLLTANEISTYLSVIEKTKPGVLLNRYEKNGAILQEDGVRFCRKLLLLQQITPTFRQEILCRLIHFYEEKNWEEELETLLGELDFAMMDRPMRTKYLEKMILLGMYESAGEYLFDYGFEEINLKRLVRLCSRRISAGVDEDRLVSLAYYVFSRGKYDECILNYLLNRYYGPTRNLVSLWQAAHDFGEDSFAVCERAIVQMLFTGYLVRRSEDLFEDYYRHTPKQEVVAAYLSFHASQYVINDQVVSERLFSYILDAHQHKEPLNDGCKLALLKFYARQSVIDAQTEAVLVEYLNYFSKRQIYPAFFKELEQKVHWDDKIREKTVIEFYSNPQNHVEIVYRILESNRQKAEFEKEEMKQVFGSLFEKELTLFYGEIIQYYIEEQRPGQKPVIVCSSRLEREADETESVSGRYDWMNEMYMSQALHDEASLNSLMHKYAKTEAVAEQLFVLREE